MLMEYLCEGELAQPWEAVERAETLEAMRAAAGVLARARVRVRMKGVWQARAVQPVSWPDGKACGQRLQSRGRGSGPGGSGHGSGGGGSGVARAGASSGRGRPWTRPGGFRWPWARRRRR
jgi:hypothetical protein